MRALRLASATIIIVACITVPATAQDQDETCQSFGSNVEIGRCYSEAYKTADKELNAVWKKVLASIDSSDYVPAPKRKEWRDAIVKAQRHWVSLKTYDCEKAIFFEWWGGSGSGIATMTCLYRMTAARTKELKERYHVK